MIIVQIFIVTHCWSKTHSYSFVCSLFVIKSSLSKITTGVVKLPANSGQELTNTVKSAGEPGSVIVGNQLHKDIDVDKRPADKSADTIENKALNLKKQEQEL